MAAVSRPTKRLTRAAIAALTAAAVIGVAHGAVSLYWGAGGNALVTTLGDRVVTAFEGLRWILIPVALLKIGFALLPLTQHAWGRAARLIRPFCWLGASVLVIWGGVNTLIGNLVLSGIINPDGGYDRSAMISHAWLWDPMFLSWGLFLAAGLLLTSRIQSGRASGTRRQDQAQSTRHRNAQQRNRSRS